MKNAEKKLELLICTDNDTFVNRFYIQGNISENPSSTKHLVKSAIKNENQIAVKFQDNKTSDISLKFENTWQDFPNGKDITQSCKILNPVPTTKLFCQTDGSWQKTTDLLG